MIMRALILLFVITFTTATTTFSQQTELETAASATPAVEFDALGQPVEGEPAFTLQQAQQWRDEMIPHVEAAAGRSFKTVPELKIVTRGEMFERWEADMKLSVLLAGADPDSNDASADIMMHMLDNMQRAGYMLGRYSTSNQTIDLPAGNISSLMKLGWIVEEHLDGACRITIAHELAHALHEQHLPFAQRALPTTSDMSRAFEATSEGFATFVQNQVALRMNQEHVNTSMQRGRSTAAPNNAAAQIAVKHYQDMYLAGARFFQHHYDDAGIDKVWDILADPPKTYLHITYPERSGEQLSMRLVPEELFDGLDQQLGLPGVRPMIMTVDADTAAAKIVQLVPEQTDFVQANMKQAHTCLFRQQGTVHAVTCYETSSNEAAKRIRHALGVAAQKQLELAAQSMPSAVQSKTSNANTQLGDAERSVFLHRLQLGDPNNSESSVHMLFAGAVSADKVLQIVVTGPHVNDEQLLHIIQFLSARLESDDLMQPVAQVDEADALVQRLRRAESFFADTAWKAEQRPLEKSAVEAWLGDDIAGQVALEMGYVDGSAVMLEAVEDSRASRRLLGLFIIECDTADSAKTLCLAFARNMSKYISSNMPAMDVNEAVATELDNGITVHRSTATISAMGQVGSIATVTSHHGNHILWWFELNNAVDESRLADFVTHMFHQ